MQKTPHRKNESDMAQRRAMYHRHKNVPAGYCVCLIADVQHTGQI
ncbi:hypothetical protein TPHV1_20103 [Treponema phagedenis]|uniref:Uncharacterized protein n=1 Tax=Treponema phagedenis TaxID=162 RepID=A0A0B7GY63_TREPH|nr:hypothetical protein TPHV1_20103 [Treponema phagedenis]